jgi:HEAT repeat protein
VGACLAALVSHDAITPEIVEALSAYTLPTDATFMRNCVLTSLSSQVQFASTKPLLDVLARHPDERVRGGAAVLLSGYDDSEVLRTLVDDPSTEVRLAVARLLRPKNVTRVRWLDRQGRSEEYRVGTDPVVDDQARQIMARLLADEDPSVREAAIASASTFDVPLDVSAYAPLVDDPDPGVRVMLATFLPAAMPGAEDLLLQLARSGDVVALEALARRLQSRPSDARQDLLMGDNLPRFLPVLSAVSASSSANESYVNRAWGDIIDQPDGSLLLLQEAERAGNDALVDRVVRGWRSRPPAETVRQVVELQSSVLADLLPRIERSVRSVFAILVGEAAKSASEGAVAAMAALAEDEQLDPYVRLSAVSVVVARGRDGWEERLLALLSSEAVRGWTPERDASLLRDVSRRLPPGDRNRVLLRIMDECGLPDALLLPLVYDFDAYAPHGEALSVAVLQRWHDDATGPTEEALYPAIERAGSMAGRIDPALVIGTVHSPRPGIAARAVQAMGRLRDPVFLPVLRECLERNWLSENDQGDLAGYAILALTGYMSDEAASILLEGAASAPYASLRKDCMEGVKAIHEYQEARAEWERRAGTRATRDDAVLALVRMLDDEDATIRAECLRGLGLLGAVEHLPRVILALKDADAAVREAAREALGRLNALESPEGVPAGEPASAPASADGGDAADVEGAEDGSDG